ncbi:MAG: cupin domain-containing protein [Candidatus Mcinerneyibacterium aminivorans]|uniref:Cupin domain-containing protein n=1 Tax=Candidatus Mcinerneyibacterium aminivorans TaxID=2703815 RepID=A0A5D0MAA5_9BACT|nr:MAG: cupin domain-containing protein [Candidatus Mcinerneyibacterium aminivorans]
MKIRNSKNLEGFKNNHNIEKAVKLLDKNYCQIVQMNLNPQDTVIEHKTPVDVSFFIVEGKVMMKIGDEEKKVKEGDLIESPKNIVHSFKNEFDEKAKVLVIKHMKSK